MAEPTEFERVWRTVADEEMWPDCVAKQFWNAAIEAAAKRIAEQREDYVRGRDRSAAMKLMVTIELDCAEAQVRALAESGGRE